jgi:hypothetical protein
LLADGRINRANRTIVDGGGQQAGRAVVEIVGAERAEVLDRVTC